MKFGMLYYDDDPKCSLLDKVATAAAQYQRRFGSQANRCYVHPSALAGDAALVRAGALLVVPDSAVLVNHLWLGVEVL
jgi:hypothetical protein